MKKQQQWWLLFKVFSSSKTPHLINSSSSSSSYNIARPFCSTTTTTNTSRLFAAVKKNLPLLIVPYQKIGYDGDGFLETKQSYNTVCDDTLGFTSLFDHDVDGLQKKKKKKALLVHKFNLPEIGDRRICGSSEGWLVSVHANGEIQLLNPFSKDLVHLPPLTAFPQVVNTYDSEELDEELVPKNTRGLCYLVDDARCIFGGARSSPTSQSFLMLGSHHFREVFLVKKEMRNNSHKEAEVKVKAAVGFRQVIDLLSSEQKLVVGHNSFLDIAHIYNKFFGPLPSSIAFIQFSKEEFVSDFITLKETLERYDDPISVLHPLTKLMEGGNTRVGNYEVYKEICSSSISKVLFAGQAEAVSSKWKNKLVELSEEIDSQEPGNKEVQSSSCTEVESENFNTVSGKSCYDVKDPLYHRHFSSVELMDALYVTTDSQLGKRTRSTTKA